MEPIINPWLIYLLNIISTLKTFFAVLGFVMVIATMISIVVFMSIAEDYDFNPENKIVSRLKKKCIIIFALTVISILMAILLPDKETLYTMLVFNYITPNNIDLGVENVKTLIDYVVETIQKLIV